MADRLAGAASPYLLQHRDNPIDWWEWGEEAFAEARRRDCPVLLSVGYAACHWCHVMARECFEDPRVAEIVNREFVAIKVDREERPDVDALYQQALALLGRPGGWPLTMFLTPSGEAFWGGTYFPPEPRHGLPGFRELLLRIAELWRHERARIEENRTAIAAALERLNRPESGRVDLAFADAVAEALAARVDPVNGGFGDAPKFPHLPVLSFLWEAGAMGRAEGAREAVRHTLERICRGGIRDHLGGGFARYAVDARWLVPHFEKMLGDNAQFIELLAEVHHASGDPLFLEAATETVAWLEREMRTEAGYASSLDADSEGEEGRFYLWSFDELERLLGPDFELFARVYGVRPEGHFEGRNILHRLDGKDPRDGAELSRIARARQILFAARERRPRPARDDKVLTDANALTLAALAWAGYRLERRDWIRHAAEMFARLVAHVADGDRLCHGWYRGRRLRGSYLDDYAQAMRAALLLHAATGEDVWIARARSWAMRVERDFREEEGLYLLVPVHARELPLRPAGATDGPVPSAVGTLAWAYAALAHGSGEMDWLERAEAILTRFGGNARRDPFGHVTLLRARRAIEQAVRVQLAGDPRHPRYRELQRTVARWGPPGHLLFHVKQDPAAAGEVRASVCRGFRCSAPVNAAEALREELRGR